MSEAGVRLDRWLWAARFFKTRGMAQAAVAGGHVHVNGRRAKPAYAVRRGDKMAITRGEDRIEVRVMGLAERRGPAKEAQALYEETEASRAAREQMRLHRAAVRSAAPAHRPDKRDRRRLIRFGRGDGS
jgi:ribosome-associated heat shock protein Hsp15